MSFLRGASSAKPVLVPTDTIVPLHPFDDNDITRGSLLYITLSFDAVLDANAIQQSLKSLMAIGEWKKLGARLRKTKDGKLEYHVPTEFTEQRPGFIFTKEVNRMGIRDHPTASRLPRPTLGRPSVQHDPQEFIELARRENGPKKLEDFLSSDEPQMSLHVVLFHDATLLSVSWLHTLCDATAMSQVLKSLVLILNGRDSEVSQVFPISVDPLATLGSSPTEPYVNEKHQLVGLALAMFFIRFFVNLLWYRNAQRVVYLPPDYVRTLKTAAVQDLQDASVHLSEGDILSTLLTRLALRDTPPNSSQNITIWNVLDVRGPLSSTLFSQSGVYIGNAVLGAIALVPAQDIVSKPLSVGASYIRRAIEQQRTPAQIHALAAISHKAKQEGRPCLFGDSRSKLFFYSNWTRAGFFQLDFGEAITETQKRPVYPVMVLFNNEAQHPLKTNTILGQDAAGGYWIEFNMEDGNWNGVQEMLEQLQADTPQA